LDMTTLGADNGWEWCDCDWVNPCCPPVVVVLPCPLLPGGTGPADLPLLPALPWLLVAWPVVLPA
jgi:hypothetical protein